MIRQLPICMAMAALAVAFLGIPLPAQLNENCTVSILNRTTRVRADGSWRIENVPATFGGVRARATCVENAITASGSTSVVNVLPAQAAFEDAFVKLTPATGLVADDFDLPVTVNLDVFLRIGDTTLDPFGRLAAAAGAKRSLESDDGFWAVVLASLFQGEEGADIDPLNPLNTLTGLSQDGTGLAAVFMESLQDEDWIEIFGTTGAEQISQQVAAHELGHLFGSEDGDGGLMNKDNPLNTTFSAETLGKIRGRDKP